MFESPMVRFFFLLLRSSVSASVPVAQGLPRKGNMIVYAGGEKSAENEMSTLPQSKAGLAEFNYSDLMPCFFVLQA